MSERLQKLLARHGIGSRREVERWITEGRVLLNSKPAQLGDQFQSGDRLVVDGRDLTARLAVEASLQALIYHKPQGQALAHREESVHDGEADDSPELTKSDRNDMELVTEHLPATRGSRWIPINPMHAGDSGLLLFTNDGALGYALTRRKRWIPTIYMVRVLAPGGSAAPPELPLHVQLDDERIEFTKVKPEGGEGANLWYRVELDRADRRAAVRALFESHHIKVSRMTQVSFGEISLPRDLPRTRHRALTRPQLESLYALAQIAAPPDPSQIAHTAKTKTVRFSRHSKRTGRASRDDSSRSSASSRAQGARSSSLRTSDGRATTGRSGDKPSPPTRRNNVRPKRPRS
jgi:23S rRNA pseudouridine2605 synthase